MGDGWGANGADLVHVEATLVALVVVANASFLAAIAVEGGLGVVECQLVAWVDWVSYFFLDLHVFFFFFMCFLLV